MIQWYARWNRTASKWLWWIVIVGLLASLPLAYERIMTERSSKKVEFVFDYRDLLDIAEYRANPREFVDQELDAMKRAGIESMAVYESTLNELRLAQRVDLYSSREAGIMTGQLTGAGDNYAYVLFKDSESQQRLQPMIERAFKSQGIGTKEWTFEDRKGLMIEAALEEAAMKTMEPDPFALELLKQKGFRIVARLSNRSLPFNEADMDRKLSQFKEAGAKTIIFEGEAVPGYTGKEKSPELEQMAGLLDKYDMTLAAIELLKAPQKGFNFLAKESRYNVIRLHSLSEAEADRLIGNITEQEQLDRIQVFADRFVLAAKDRNIRMIFLNARPSKNPEKASYTDPLEQIRETLRGDDGALKRISQAGYTLGPAHPFTIYNSSWQGLLKPVVVVASVALIALTLAYFFPWLLLISFVVGIGMGGALYILSSNMLFKLLALGVGVCAPTLGMMIAIQSIRHRMAGKLTGAKLGYAINLFIRTSFISMIGVVFIVALLNNVIYSLVIDQYRGVSLLHLAPILIIGIYLLFFSEGLKAQQIVDRVKRLLSSSVSVLWVVIAGALVAGIMYYLSRTGNEGKASTFEKLFRSLLENNLGVRPRIKEFLFAHPVFILGAYLAIKYRPSALYIFILGIIGQLSVVDTFAHLHTPVYISAIRVGYGMLLGVIVGIIFIAVWEMLARSWKRWVLPSKG
ncbi:DUF5693 family protein [Paenibacillus sp. J2TS4]|uniref:DUF5693 family protein n=1 Tax=Paenibacillus sp. J2TS4 TaxID=2807194 RepID=UPI001B12556D|nr:DUF5693 family protein [Paenibacillus sp. J2TS4]GIP35578.1 hypothetical protein J2TS4_47880 [Paenibacillus sp. J2TS4]